MAAAGKIGRTTSRAVVDVWEVTAVVEVVPASLATAEDIVVDFRGGGRSYYKISPLIVFFCMLKNLPAFGHETEFRG